MRNIYITAEQDEVRIPSARHREDVRLVIDGPRGPFSLVNETNGMTIRFAQAIQQGERLWVVAQEQRAFLKDTRIGAEERDCIQDVHIPQHTSGYGWFRIEKGPNVLRVIPL